MAAASNSDSRVGRVSGGGGSSRWFERRDAQTHREGEIRLDERLVTVVRWCGGAIAASGTAAAPERRHFVPGVWRQKQRVALLQHHLDASKRSRLGGADRRVVCANVTHCAPVERVVCRVRAKAAVSGRWKDEDALAPG
jgi:hypothetical protein